MSILLLLQSCFILPGKGKNQIVFKLNRPSSKVVFNPNLISINIASDIVTIQGSGFSALKKLEVQTASGTTASLNVDTLSDSQIIASAKSAISLLVGTTFNLIMSSAEASTTFPITFTLQDGVVTSTKLHSMGAQNGQVLQFNGSNWLPTSIASPMLFLGMWDASTGTPTGGEPYYAGDYFIISTAGTFGPDTYVVGDWTVYDGTDWNRVFTDTGTKLSKTGGTLTGDLIFDTQAKFKGAANYVTLKASAGLVSDVTLTLPTSIGTNGQVLTTDGAGVMSWQTVASGGGTGAVFSVNSQTGTVTLTTTDIAEGSNQYFTTARALTAVTASLATKQSVDTTLTSLAAYNTDGILVQTAADTFTGRTLTGTTNRLTVTNGNGVAGNPTLNLDTTLLPSPAGGDAGKFLKATAADTSVWTALGSSDITTALGFTPINKAGDTISSGTFTFDTAAVLRTLDPIGLTDVANKQYVDAAVASVGTASSSWTASGTDVYRASGSVGIGTTTPTTTLHVVGTSLFEATDQSIGLTLRNNDSLISRNPVIKIINHMGAMNSGFPMLTFENSAGSLAAPTALANANALGWINFSGADGTTTGNTSAVIYSRATEAWTATSHGANIVFGTTTNGTSAYPTNRMIIDNNGNVGIGNNIALPGSNLLVKGTTSDNTTSGFNVTNSGNTSMFYIRNDGKIGIGTTAPNSSLDINGELRVRGSTTGHVGFKAAASTSSTTYTWPTTSGTNTYVLSTDGTGILSWVAQSGGGPADSDALTEGSTNLFYTTARAAAKQDVDATLTALSGFNTNGILVQTAPDTFVGRTLTGTANRITVTNGDGVSGSPTINLDTTLLPSPVLADAGKFLKATAADTSAWTALGSSDITTALGFTPINKAGDTLTGTLTLAAGTFTIGPSGFLIVPNPVLLTDAVNKQYVDGLIGGSWSASGTDIYRTSGNVGIGTSAPTATLTVVGTASISGAVNIGSTLAVAGNSMTVGDITIRQVTTIWPYAVTLGISNTADWGSLALGRSNNLGPSGNGVSVGISNTNGGDNSLTLGNTNSALAVGAIAIGNNVSNSIINSLMIGPSDSAKMTITASGSVGIGTSDPQAALDVNGVIKNNVSTFSGAFTCGTSTLDFSTSNNQRLAPSGVIAGPTCNVALSNLATGGNYTLVVTGNAAVNAVTYTFTGYTFKYLPGNNETIAGADTIYSIYYDGTTVYVTWAAGYQ